MGIINIEALLMAMEEKLAITKNADEMLVQNMQANYAQHTKFRDGRFRGRGNYSNIRIHQSHYT